MEYREILRYLMFGIILFGFIIFFYFYNIDRIIAMAGLALVAWIFMAVYSSSYSVVVSVKPKKRTTLKKWSENDVIHILLILVGVVMYFTGDMNNGTQFMLIGLVLTFCSHLSSRVRKANKSKILTKY